jgi:hypothetical protein
MRKIALLIAVFAATVLLQLYAVPAYATMFSKTYLSRTGNDANICTDGSPCRGLDRALALTADGGEIDCLDAGLFLSLAAIAQSVTIDCHGTTAGTLAPTIGDGIDINAPGGTVILRGLIISGIGGVGVNITAAATVYVEDCVITGFSLRREPFPLDR